MVAAMLLNSDIAHPAHLPKGGLPAIGDPNFSKSNLSKGEVRREGEASPADTFGDAEVV